MATPTYRSATLDLACCNYGFKDFQVSVSWLFKGVANTGCMVLSGLMALTASQLTLSTLPRVG